MSGFKMWDDFTQKEIRDKYKNTLMVYCTI